MTSPYRNQILAQVLDGKRGWSIEDLGPGADANDFLTQVVAPLRELQYEGIIENVEEVPFAIDGNLVVTAVEIIGAINYDAHEED